MKTKTLNKCLSKIDMIIFNNVMDSDIIVKILDDIRKYVINSNLKIIRDEDQGKPVIMVLQFINYMIQTLISSSVTNEFINHCCGLRLFILKLEGGNLFIEDEDEKIDFDNCCNSFLNKYVVKDEDDDETDNEYDNETENEDVDDNKTINE